MVLLFRGVAAGATRLGETQRSLAEAKRLCPCFLEIHKDTPRRWQAIRLVGGTGHIVDGRGREGHCTCALLDRYDSSQRDWLVREGREDGAGAGK